MVNHGISYGLALDISLACDIRVCTKDTRYSVKEVDIGMFAFLFNCLGDDYALSLDIVACSMKKSTNSSTPGLAADIGTLTRLPKSQLPFSFIKDVALTAREFFAPEALSVGLVSSVYDNKAEAVTQAISKAALIATKSPVAVLGTKEVLNYSRDHSVQDGLNYVAVWNAAYLQTQDVKDALMAGLKRKKAMFAKL